MSRQRNDACCYAVFDRSGLVRGKTSALTEVECDALCKRFNVDPI